jgi:hypothetical protein
MQMAQSRGWQGMRDMSARLLVPLWAFREARCWRVSSNRVDTSTAELVGWVIVCVFWLLV